MAKEEKETYIKEVSEFLNMAEICRYANINYGTYRNWKNRGLPFSEEKED